MNCKCRWDGNLDGKLLRCQEHAAEVKAERKDRKINWKSRALEAERVLAKVRSHSRPVRYVVEIAEGK